MDSTSNDPVDHVQEGNGAEEPVSAPATSDDKAGTDVAEVAPTAGGGTIPPPLSLGTALQVQDDSNVEAKKDGEDQGEKDGGETPPKADKSEPTSPMTPMYTSYASYTLNLYDVSQYTFGKKAERQRESRKNESEAMRERHLEEKYQETGMRRSVGAVLLLQNHRFPHILLLQVSKGPKSFRLPGGRLRPGESTHEGLKRKLQSKLGPPADVTEPPKFEIGEHIATWWSPDFSGRCYPYVPAHVTKPKESLTIVAVQLPESCTFAVPKNYQLLAVPLFEIYDNMEQYGPVITAVPSLLSRFHVNFIGG